MSDENEDLISSDLAKEMLRDIRLKGGAARVKTNPIIIIGGAHNNLSSVLNLSAGLPRLNKSVIAKFELTGVQPEPLAAMNPFQIRCCLCREVISYPAWVYNIKYNVNHFYYFICFDYSKPDQPTTLCYRPFEG